MKAKVNNSRVLNISKTGAPVLSVSLIVKNEEKYLDDCLTAIKPLLEAVHSELVIVDTGSTDKTVEIAKKHTDKVYFFEWINDFAAARNFGLEKCSGEWFMFLDADEIFDSDLSEMINFFNNASLRNKYNSATYVVLNLTNSDNPNENKERSQKLSMNAARAVKRTSSTRFVHAIHEAFERFDAPTYCFKTKANHYGYYFTNEKERDVKRRRNLSLLLNELEKDPNDLRIMLHVTPELPLEERAAYIERMLKVARGVKGGWSEVAFFNSVLFYREHDVVKALDLIEECVERFKSNNAALLDLYIFKGEILNNKNDLAGAVKALRTYLNLYRSYKLGKLDAHIQVSVFLEGVNEATYQKVKGYVDVTEKKLISQNERKVNKSGIILSVGMIVKNEEKDLDRCLTAIKPLLEAVPSELVIVDTGSTDKTVEIAKKHTDKVYFFEWVNDFAAARNFGLEKCSGEWFMFLDADDIFDDDLSDMIDFFKDENLRNKYNSATYTTVNFLYNEIDPSTLARNVAHQARVTRRDEDLRFVHPIHESFSKFPPPVYHFKTFDEHYGYFFASEEEREKKRQRNLSLLLKELEKNPNDLRIMNLMTPELPNEEKDAHMEKILEIARRVPKVNVGWRDVSFFNAISIFRDLGEDDKVLKHIDEALKIISSDKSLNLDFYLYKGEILEKRVDLNGAFEAYNRYLKLYELFAAGKLDVSAITAVDMVGASLEVYSDIKKRVEDYEEKNRKGNSEMKSHFNNSDKSGVILSIGMIVKNEEKYLDDCLTAIKPLLEAVPSELVIVDTGSTDKTVEIAKKHTDKVYFFEWINDFSAARNFGLEKCSGEWFMFLDADDIFDSDLSEMINFFKDEKLREGYNSAYYVARNYHSLDEKSYFITQQQRVARLTPEVHFEGRIHEVLENIYLPSYYFNTFEHHYGYAFENDEIKSAKLKRNLDLIYEELKENLDDIRRVCQVVDCLSSKREAEPYVIKSIELSKNADSSIAYVKPYIAAINHYYSSSDFEKAVDYANEYIKLAKYDEANLIDAYAYKSLALFRLNKHAPSFEAYLKYREYFSKFHEGKLDKSTMVVCSVNYLDEFKRDYLTRLAAVSLAKERRFSEAYSLLEEAYGLNYPARIEEIDPDLFAEAVIAISGIAGEHLNAYEENPELSFEKLAKYYSTVKSSNDENKIEALDAAYEKLYYEAKDRKSFAEKAAKASSGLSGLGEGDFFALTSIIADYNSDKLRDFFNKRLDENKSLRGYSEAFYVAFKNNFDISEILPKLKFEQIAEALFVVSAKNNDYSKLILNYCADGKFSSSVIELYFAVSALEKAAVSASAELTAAEKSELFNRFIQIAAVYVMNVYNPALLNESDIGALPPLHRFGYYIAAGFNALEAGNKLGYVRALKSALGEYPDMKNVISFLIEGMGS